MKKIFALLFASVVAVPVFAAGVDICGGGAGAHNATAAVAAGGFVMTAFTPKCSSNVFLAYEQSPVAFVTAASSAKGKFLFTGTTGGGGIQQGGACTGGICTANQTTGATAAILATST